MQKGRKCPKCGYERNAPEAAWCGLCYEPLNKKSAAAVAPAPKPAPPAGVSLKSLALRVLAPAAILGAAALASIRIMGPLEPAGPGRGEAAAQVNRFKDRSEAADRLLDTHISLQKAFLAEIMSEGADPEGFGVDGRYTMKLFRLEDSYAGSVAALQLPAPAAADPELDAAYLRWSAEHRRREQQADEDFNARYGQLAAAATAAGHPPQ